MDLEALLREATGSDSAAFDMLLTHGRAVAGLTLRLLDRAAAGTAADRTFAEQAAVLHDIGAAFTHAPAIGLSGREPYLRHGILGQRFLEARGFPRHARVCERHVGVGLTAAEISARGLPLPARDMLPESIEEIAICFADKFFSKLPGQWRRERDLDEVRRVVGRHGPDKVAVIDAWALRFGLAP